MPFLLRRARFGPPGSPVLRDIRRLQKSTDLLIRKKAFERVVREIAQEMKDGLRFEGDAFVALQEASESFVVGLFGDAGRCAIHAKRKTVMVEDLRLACRMREERTQVLVLEK